MCCSILHFIQDGIVVRFHRVGFMTEYYGKSGGLGNFQDSLEPRLEACQRLKATYPEYGAIMRKKTGMPDFRLKRISSKIASDV